MANEILLLIALFTSPVHLFPTGAPPEACSTLRPQHGVLPQNTSSPFELDVHVFQDVEVPDMPIMYSYRPNRTYSLVLQVNPNQLAMDSTLAFRGFLIQSRLVADDSNLGMFHDGVGYRLSNCTPSYIGATHIDNDTKTSVALQWTAPPANSGPIHFRYSVVQSQHIYWERLLTVELIERRCDVNSYFDSTSESCVQSCPIGYQGIFANSTCAPFPLSFDAGFSSDMFFTRIPSCIANASTLFNFTITTNFTEVLSIIVSLIGSSRELNYFKLLGGAASNSYFNFETSGPFTLISDGVIALNAPGLVLPVETFTITLSTVIVGVGSSGHEITQITSMIVVDVIEPPDVCLDQPCSHGGTCTQNCLEFSCSCPPAYTGPTCDILFNPCGLNNCLNGASCTNVGTMDYACECAFDFTGRDCEIAVDSCSEEFPNCFNGTCVDGLGFFSCNCNTGFTGELCEIDIDECEGVNCNNGVCQDLIGNHTCDCYEGWTGNECDVDIDFCMSESCDSIGSVNCTEENSTFSCDCNTGFTGSDCSVDINECNSSPCLNNGTCENLLFGLFECQCTEEFSGSTCEILLFPCTLFPCKNGGNCSDLELGNFSCTCQDGYAGVLCEEDDPNFQTCSIGSCTNGGTCVEEFGPWTSCNCPAGFSGLSCEEDLQFCSCDTCLNGGSCMEGVGDETSCVCRDGFTGDDCSTDLPFCTPSTCQNGGTCHEGVGVAITCECTDDYTGDDCAEIFTIFPNVSTGHPTVFYLLPGSNVIVSCQFIGQPPPMVSWEHDGTLVSAIEGVQIVNGANETELSVAEVTEERGGIYSCIASNIAGSSMIDFTLLVLPEPVESLVVTASESSLSLNWTYQSSGSRRRTGTEVVIEGDVIFTRLTVSPEATTITHGSLHPLSNYTLTVYVLSALGRSLPTTVYTSTLSLKIPPPVISAFHSFSATELFLHWEHPDFTATTTTLISAWILELSLPDGEVLQRVTQHDSSSDTAMFSGLEEETEYWVRVAGENTRGIGIFSEYAKTTTPTTSEVQEPATRNGFSLVTIILTSVIAVLAALIVVILHVLCICVCYYKRRHMVNLQDPYQTLHANENCHHSKFTVIKENKL